MRWLIGWQPRCDRHALEIMPDHVHLFILPTLRSRSYYAGTVGHVSQAAIYRYIESQKRS
jgi:REP element-mobilizing transposase RayT